MHVVRRRRLNNEAFDQEFCFPGAVADAFGHKKSKPLLQKYLALRFQQPWGTGTPVEPKWGNGGLRHWIFKASGANILEENYLGH